jgi:hypothetical protein
MAVRGAASFIAIPFLFSRRYQCQFLGLLLLDESAEAVRVGGGHPLGDPL